MIQQVPLYKIWPGKNRFCFNGKFMCGPQQDQCLNMCTWLTIIGFSMPFIIIVIPKLCTELSVALALPPILLFISTLFFLFLTQFSDPGIIPRKQIIKILNNDDLNSFVAGDEESHFGNTLSFDQFQESRRKICDTCAIVRPQRSAHCSECDNCVMVHDHHCPFVNNCIGKNNYRYFASFLLSLCGLIVTVIAGLICFIVVITGYTENAKTFVIVLMIAIGLAGIFVIGLFIYHLYLRIIGKTTRESIKRTVVSEANDDFLWLGPSVQYFNPRQIVYVDRNNFSTLKN